MQNIEITKYLLSSFCLGAPYKELESCFISRYFFLSARVIHFLHLIMLFLKSSRSRNNNLEETLENVGNVTSFIDKISDGVVMKFKPCNKEKNVIILLSLFELAVKCFLLLYNNFTLV